MIYGAQVQAFDAQLQENRTKNLQSIEEQVGRGFQTLLTKFASSEGRFISQSEASNLTSGSRDDKGERRTAFTSYKARAIEKALALPRCSLDLPSWHFKQHLSTLWQYASKAAEEREWFDSLLRCLLEVPAFPPNDQSKRSDSQQHPAIAAALTRLRDQAKSA